LWTKKTQIVPPLAQVTSKTKNLASRKSEIKDLRRRKNAKYPENSGSFPGNESIFHSNLSLLPPIIAIFSVLLSAAGRSKQLQIRRLVDIQLAPRPGGPG
jgi:hypothetical protein